MSYKTVKNYRERLKNRIIYVMGEKCQCCGYNKCQSALELHHVNPTEKSFTISNNTNRSWEAVVQEIKKDLPQTLKDALSGIIGTDIDVDLERDNTGDGLLYLVELKKSPNKIQIKKITPIFITTYINTAWEFVVKKLDDNFINYLKGVPRKNWADYMEKRKNLNEKITKDIIVWQ